MNLSIIFVVFVIFGSSFNIDAEPVFRKPSGSGIQKNKRIVVKQTGGHNSKPSGHRGHRKPPCICVAESVNGSSLQPVTAISGALIPEPDVFFPGTVVDPVIVIPGAGSSVTTAATGAATTFVPSMC